MKITALLLVLWYCMSIIGFDVHTCSGSGRTFVTSFVTGMTCEDIHPEHQCGHESFCAAARHETEHHDAADHACCPEDDDCRCLSINAKSCCSDDIQVLLLTGSRTDEDHRHYDVCSCGHCPCVEAFCSDLFAVHPQDLLIADPSVPDKGLIAHKNVQSLLRIWRI